MSQAAQNGGHKALVLVVDDEPDVRTSISLILKLEDFDVVTASHAGMALELAERQRPNVLLTDFMMPWMNGRELIAKIKATPSGRAMPSILMSGVDPGEPRTWDAFLRKPMDINELLATIQRLLPGAKPER